MRGLRLGLGLTGTAAVAAPATIGGTAIGAAGTVGTYTEGFVLSGGDDFDSALDILGPATPFGKYLTNRGCYIPPSAGNQPRGSTLLGGWDVDPLWTGHLDTNRGAKVASMSDTITQSGGKISLNCRTATAPEQTHLGRAVNCLSSMFTTALAMMGKPPFVMEWMEQRSALTASHMTGWSNQPFRSQDVLQFNFEADSQTGGGGDGTKLHANVSVWTAGVVTESGAGGTAQQSPSQATTHTYAFKVDATGDCTMYIDGSLIRTYTTQEALALGASSFLIFSNHIYDGQWAGGNSPAPYDIHWYRFWRASTGAHHTPITPTVTINADSGVAFSSTLATQTAVWGGAVTEQVMACMAEPNEPGGTTNGVTYAALPTGVTYNSGTRALAGTLTTPGRLNIVRFVDQGGDTCVPQRIALNIGPKLTASSTTGLQGSAFSYDLYAVCDCGVLVSDSSGAKAKTISVTGLPTGLSYSDSTGLITGTPTGSGTSTIAVTITNSVSQSVTTNFDINVTASGHTAGTGVAAPTLTGSPTLVASYDFDKDSSLGLTSGNIDSIADAESAGGITLSSTSTNRPTQTTRSGLHVGLFARASSQRLTANSVISALDSTNGGTIIVIAEPVTTANSCCFFEMAEGSDALNRHRLHIGASTSVGYNFRKYDNAAGVPIAQVGSAYNSGIHLLIGHYQGHAANVSQRTAKLNFDGAATALVSAASGFFPTGMAWTMIGCDRQSSAFSLHADAYIYRILIYSAELSSTNLEEVAVWANTNYGTANNA